MLELRQDLNDRDFPTGAGKSIQSELRARFLLRPIYLYSIHALILQGKQFLRKLGSGSEQREYREELERLC